MGKILSALWSIITDPSGIAWLVIGTFVGIVFAAVPGINGVMAVVLFAPLTFHIGLIPGLLGVVGILQGSNFGGCITSVLFNIPGDPAAVCDMLDGYPMGQRGEAGKAIASGLLASCCGGFLAAVAMYYFAPTLVWVGIKFGSPAIFSFILFGLTMVVFMGSNMLSSLIGLSIGILLGTIGLSPGGGVGRFDFGLDYLLGGVNFIVALIGLFAVNQLLQRLSEGGVKKQIKLRAVQQGLVCPTLKEIKTWLKGLIPRSTAIGTIVGLIPGIGAATAAIVSYGITKQLDNHPEEFGTGRVEGLVAPETANNASGAGAFTTLLTLGIPGSATAAVAMGVLLIAGIVPGPLLFAQRPDIKAAVFGGMVLVNLLILVLGVFVVKFSLKILNIPGHIVDSFIIVFSFVGIYGLRNSIADVIIAFVFGFIGYILSKIGIESPAIILGLILGPLLEKNLVLAVVSAKNGAWVFLTNPVSALFIALSIVSLLYSYRLSQKGKKRVPSCS